MQFIIESIDTITIVKITGRIDALCVDDLQAFFMNLLQNGHIYLVIDCKEMTYLSSGGMRVFLSVLNEAEKRSGKIFFCNFCNMVKEVILLTGIGKYFIYYSDVNEAKNQLREFIEE